VWWAVIVSGLLIAVLVSGFAAGAARIFGPEPSQERDPWSEHIGDELERDAWNDSASDDDA